MSKGIYRLYRLPCGRILNNIVNIKCRYVEVIVWSDLESTKSWIFNLQIIVRMYRRWAKYNNGGHVQSALCITNCCVHLPLIMQLLNYFYIIRVSTISQLLNSFFIKLIPQSHLSYNFYIHSYQSYTMAHDSSSYFSWFNLIKITTSYISSWF